MTFALRTRGLGRALARAAGGRAVARAPGRAAPPAAGAAASIYDQVTAAGVNAVLQGLSGVAADLTPAAGWNFDSDAVDFVGGITLAAVNGAALAASPHGQAAPQVDAANKCWVTADTAALNFGTAAFALLARVKFDALPPSQSVWVGKGLGAGAHYAGLLSPAGALVVEAKNFGPPSLATGTVDLTGGTWRWLLVYRSVAGATIGFHCASDNASGSFGGANDLSTTANGFALGLLLPAGTTEAAVDCSVDHLLAFSGAAAESVIANRVALITALEAAE